MTGVLQTLEGLEGSYVSLSPPRGARALVELGGRARRLRVYRDQLRGRVRTESEAGQIVGLSRKLQRLQAVLDAYHLTGVSGRLNHGTSRMLVSIIPGFGGQYLEPFSLELQVEPLPLKVTQHNIPACIPIPALARQHLRSGSQAFLHSLAQHLNAMACRRYQAQRLQECYADHLVGPVQRSLLCNELKFQYQLRGPQAAVTVTVRVDYTNRTHWLPTCVSLHCTEPVPDCVTDRLREHQSLFEQRPVHDAMEEIRGQEMTVSRDSLP